MQIEKYLKPSFSVIGRMGSSKDNPLIAISLWDDANEHFSEISHLAKLTESGALSGIWGAMSDFSLSFLPWENGFSEGLYLAGVECREDAEPPEGWVKWTLPGFEYLRIENDRSGVFEEMIGYMEENGITLAGAVQEYTDLSTGKEYMLFPTKKL